MWIEDMSGDWINSDHVFGFCVTMGSGEMAGTWSVRYIPNDTDRQTGKLTPSFATLAEAQARLRQIIKAIQGGMKVFEFEEEEG